VPRHVLGHRDPLAAYALVSLTHQLAALLADVCPALVLTHPYEGGHPDHDATAFAVHAARARSARPPRLVEFACYHAGPSGLVTGAFLPPPPGTSVHPPPVEVVLSPAQRAHRERLLDCFPTQRTTLAAFPRDRECFRPAPRHDFTRPPHPGRLHHEGFPWGMPAARFVSLAMQALGELDLEEAERIPWA
jgi:LmbE family N-acetylglucosaminyl deacetylase